MTDPTTQPPRPWWQQAVFYQIYVRSFADSTGNGVGDLPGIRSRLPYLHDLGIDALWLTPFYPSPLADGGYDVADYRDVDPTFGTLADFDALVADAHRLGLRVVVDLVPNHTSDDHVWFQQALRDGPGSPARDRYIFRTGKGPDGAQPPNDWQSTFGGPAWTRVVEADGRPGEWYLHLFDSRQPDLDWRNGEVWEEFESVLRFWLDRGVDGFRVDVAHGLWKADGLPDAHEGSHGILDAGDEEDHRHRTPYWDQDEVHEIYRAWRKVLDSYDGDRMMVAESWVFDPDRLAMYVRPDEHHQAFNFDFLKAEWDADGMRDVIDMTTDAQHAVGASCTWVLSNHDVVRHVTRYGGGETGLRRARAALLLLLALPGSVYVYQGEELGLPEVTDLPDDVLQDPKWERSGHTDRGRDGCRVPIPWSGTEPPFGFGPTGSTGTWLPMPAGWRDLTVEAQSGDPTSMLSLYRTALRLRRTLSSLGAGELRWLPSPPGTLVFARDPEVVCAVNLTGSPVDLPRYGEVLLASAPLPDDGRTLPGDSTAWYRLS